ncbi:hypothetical protein BG011_003589 [Mortierella polycephala]|uniref:SURP motif domain-containing protein n=1 Tax=Mortierella polycephala TaxID=41804 RepID=A0A9P6Q0R7_9FUNG|nr:hypothetical protein BG011_003589 [Mortierella polycephala]
MWNDPDLDSHRDQPSTTVLSGSRAQRNKTSKEELTAFGYECLLFRNDGLADAIEQGQMLITWQGQDPASEDALWLDRYDARNLLDDERLFTYPREVYDQEFQLEATDLDEDRFEDLDSDEEILFDMDEDEREEYLARKCEENEQHEYRGVHYDYDKDSSEQVNELAFQLHFEVPEGMAIPESEKTLALIERTAKFVSTSSEPMMEIILQAKQATNPNFAFMSRRHRLFQFYKHVRWLMQTGLYEYAEDARLREAEEARAELEQSVPVTTEGESKICDSQESALHFDIEKVIEKTIEFLGAHDCASLFEEWLLSLNDTKFQFMKPSHPWHEHYVRRRHETKEAQNSIGGAHGEAISISNPTAIDLEHARVDDECQPGRLLLSEEANIIHGHKTVTLRAMEMQRLDRLQRVKELLQQKHKATLKTIDEAVVAAEMAESWNKSGAQKQGSSTTFSSCDSHSRPRSRSRSRSWSSSRSRSSSPDMPQRKRVRRNS